MTGGVEFPVVESPLVPPGTAYIVPVSPAAYEWPPLRFLEHPWPPATYRLTEAAAGERRRALDYLAGLLDRLCADVSLDPEAVWRGPLRHRTNEAAFRAEVAYAERVAMSVLNPRRSAIITSV